MTFVHCTMKCHHLTKHTLPYRPIYLHQSVVKSDLIYKHILQSSLKKHTSCLTVIGEHFPFTVKQLECHCACSPVNSRSSFLEICLQVWPKLKHILTTLGRNYTISKEQPTGTHDRVCWLLKWVSSHPRKVFSGWQCFTTSRWEQSSLRSSKPTSLNWRVCCTSSLAGFSPTAAFFFPVGSPRLNLESWKHVFTCLKMCKNTVPAWTINCSAQQLYCLQELCAASSPFAVYLTVTLGRPITKPVCWAENTLKENGFSLRSVYRTNTQHTAFATSCK